MEYATLTLNLIVKWFSMKYVNLILQQSRCICKACLNQMLHALLLVNIWFQLYKERPYPGKKKCQLNYPIAYLAEGQLDQESQFFSFCRVWWLGWWGFVPYWWFHRNAKESVVNRLEPAATSNIDCQGIWEQLGWVYIWNVIWDWPSDKDVFAFSFLFYG